MTGFPTLRHRRTIIFCMFVTSAWSISTWKKGRRDGRRRDKGRTSEYVRKKENYTISVSLPFFPLPPSLSSPPYIPPSLLAPP